MGYTHEMAEEDGQRVWCECGMLPSECMCEKYNCDICHDTGEVTVDEQVYPGEPHTAPIGTAPCECVVGEINDEGELDQDR